MHKSVFKAINILLIASSISSCAILKKAPQQNDPVAPTTPSSPSTSNTAKTSASNTSGKIQSIDPEQFKKLLYLDEIQLVDVRTQEEFQAGHIKDALNIDIKQANFKSKLSSFDKNKPILVYCRSGKRSSDAAEILKEMGFTKIVSLEGGMIAWEEADLPINK